MRKKQPMHVCFLLLNFLKGINLCARCHSCSLEDQSPLFTYEAGTVWDGTRMAALHVQAALPPSCPGLISVIGDGVALGPFRLWHLG